MKKIYSALLLSFGLATLQSNAQCNASFIYSSQANGIISFTSTSTPANSLTAYTWYFGDGGSATGSGVAGQATWHQYSANANFVVTLIINNATAMCSDSVSQTVAISNYTPPSGCSLNAGFSNYLPGGSGNMNFTNNSSGTLTSTTYTWDYGDGSPNTYLTNGAHNYAANGNYTVTLYANNNVTPTCVDTQTMPVTITNVCGLNASFNHTVGANGNVSFVSTSTGTNANTYYTWYFGDNTTGTAVATSHTYQNGTWYATLSIQNSSIAPTCIDTIMQPIVVTTNTCLAQAGFIYTAAPGGVVTFSNASTGANANTSYTWNFGNGTISNNPAAPTTTYLATGNYTVSLVMNNGNGCTSTVYQLVSVNAGTCVANANFTLNYGGSPGVWNAVPAYPWNVSAASWSWGDGSTSTNLYGTHNYSVSGNYFICLSVTLSCGDTATSCNTYSVYRSASASMIQINVVQPPLVNVDQVVATGITKSAKPAARLRVQPNPSHGIVSITTEGMSTDKANIVVLDALGREVLNLNQDIEQGTGSTMLDLSNYQSGIYFVRVKSGTELLSSRIVVQH